MAQYFYAIAFWQIARVQGINSEECMFSQKKESKANNSFERP
jgi:hypothetical protein